MGLFSFLKSRKEPESELHEYCPRCDAILTLQKGYDHNVPFWVCKGCGETLINPRVRTETDIAWICDKCGDMLNEQQGFAEDCGEWHCTECGFVNIIDESNLYFSDEEYKMDLQNPYKGMTDDDMLEIMSFEEVDYIDGREDIVIVKDQNEKQFVKKILSTYDKSVYRYLMENPVKHMPRILGVYEGANYLVVIEEYMEGITLDRMLEKDTFSKELAVNIAKDVCAVLKDLHSRENPIIHRDVKPSNIMITKEGERILLDMNVAKWVKEETEDTRFLGTLYYAAPEQLGYGFSASSEKTDIYAVGVLLNVLVTGKLPKEEKAGGSLWSIIERCIRLNVEERFSDQELIVALDDYLRNHRNRGE